MKALAVILAILAFLICLVIGIQAGSSLSRQPAVFNQSSALSLPSGTQRTLVLIQADDLAGAHPKLTGVYFLLYLPEHAALSFVPVYPDSDSRYLADAARLEQTFSLTSNGAPSSTFLDALRAYRVPWNGYLLFDAPGAASLMAYLDQGGSEQTMAAPQATPAAMQQDADSLIDDICTDLNTSSHAIDWNQAFSKLVPGHFHTDLGYEIILSDWKSMLDANEPFTCKLIRP